jgi:glycosyltransferase involved in cell wall biosynthesis
MSEPSPEVWLETAQIASERKRHADAHRAAESALDLRPGWLEALNIALHASAKLGRRGAFCKHAAAVRAIPHAERPRLSDKKLGRYALLAGAYDLASEIGERLLDRDPHSAAGIFLVASAAWEVGDTARAEALLAGALASGDEGAFRAVFDYRLRLDDPRGAGEVLRRSAIPGAAAAVDVTRAHNRRGDPLGALEMVRWAREAGLQDPGLDAEEASALTLERILDGSWRPPRERCPRPVVIPGRVLHLVTRSLPYHTTGGTCRNHYVARAQRALGLDAIVATGLGFPRSHGYEMSELTEWDGVVYRHLRENGPVDGLDQRLRDSVSAVLALVRELRPAVLHPASDFRNALVALEVGEVAGIPVVYEVRGFPEERLRPVPGSRAWADRSVARRELERRSLTDCDRIVTLAEVMKRHIQSKGIDGEKITVIPNGVDADAFAPRTSDRDLARQHGIPAGVTVLGYVSSFKRYERIERIVETTADLLSRGYPVAALLVGDGEERLNISERARELGVADSVIFTGRVDHECIADYYALIDLFICPRGPEATSELVTPLKPFEAMAMARPVIVSDTPALREIVADGETGRTFRADDRQELVEVCRQLIDRPEEADRLGAAGRAWVLAERSWTAHGRTYLELYEQLGVLDTGSVSPSGG